MIRLSFFLFFSSPDNTDFSSLPENIKDYIATLQVENTRCTNEIQSLQTQLSNLTAVMDFADSTKIAEIDDLKQRHQDELATINTLMEGKRRNRKGEKNIISIGLETIRDRIGDARGKYENDMNILRRKVEILQQENYELKLKVADDK